MYLLSVYYVPGSGSRLSRLVVQDNECLEGNKIFDNVSNYRLVKRWIEGIRPCLPPAHPSCLFLAYSSPRSLRTRPGGPLVHCISGGCLVLFKDGFRLSSLHENQATDPWVPELSKPEILTPAWHRVESSKKSNKWCAQVYSSGSGTAMNLMASPSLQTPPTPMQKTWESPIAYSPASSQTLYERNSVLTSKGSVLPFF